MGRPAQGPLIAMLLMELARCHARRPVMAFAFRAQAPLAGPVGDRYRLIGNVQFSGNGG